MNLREIAGENQSRENERERDRDWREGEGEGDVEMFDEKGRSLRAGTREGGKEIQSGVG